MNTPPYDPVQLRGQFLSDGYVLLAGFFNAAEIAHVREHLARFIRDVVPTLPAGHVLYENKDDKGTLKQLELSEHDPYFRAMLVSGELEKLASVALASPVEGKALQYFNKPPRLGKPTPPHQDGYYFMITPPEAITMWLALDEADEENGCIRYVRGSHRSGMRPHGRSETLGFSQGITDFGTREDLTNEVLLPALPDDLLIHHAMTIHRAEGNRSRVRNRPALGFVYYSTTAREDKKALVAYQKKLTTELAAAGKI